LIYPPPLLNDGKYIGYLVTKLTKPATKI